jgi:hypothetical protein
MYRKSKGFTLLEIVIYMGLSSMILLIGYKLVMEVEKIYIQSVEESLSLNSVEEAFITLDNFARGYNIDNISNSDNKLIFSARNYTDIPSEKYVFEESGSNLLMIYYNPINKDEESYRMKRLLIKDIKNFKVITKGKLIFITFVKGGITYTKCL